MGSWKYTTRKIDGKRTKVKVMKRKGKCDLVRKVGVRNYSDKGRDR